MIDDKAADAAVDIVDIIKNAIEEYLRIVHKDPTVIIQGYILSASGSGVDGEGLGFILHGSKTKTLGLLALLGIRIDEAAYKRIEEAAYKDIYEENDGE